MKRHEFVKFVQNHRTDHVKKTVVQDLSVTDPSFAQTGRQIIFNPLPIETRIHYIAGVKLNEENPHQFNEFDKLYPDTFKAMREAQDSVTKTKTKLNELQRQQQQQQQQQPQN